MISISTMLGSSFFLVKIEVNIVNRNPVLDPPTNHDTKETRTQVVHSFLFCVQIVLSCTDKIVDQKVRNH